MMGVLKMERHWGRFVITCLLIILIMWMILHQSHQSSFYVKSNSRLLTTHSASYYPKSKSNLLQVVRRATMEDRTVILTLVNKAWATPGSVLDLFLESFQIGQGTKHLLNHIVVANLDKQAFHYCNSVHPNCFFVQNSIANDKINPDHPKFGWRIIDLIKQVLDLGYNVVFTEADVMWLRDPFSNLDPQKVVEVACDFPTANHPNMEIRADSGVFHVKSFDTSIEIFKMMKLLGILFHSSGQESFCEILENRKVKETVGRHLNHLNLTKFTGFCNPEVKLIEISTLRANCCENTTSKVHDLKLVLEDWKKVAAAGFQGKIPSWRAPKKCRG